MKSLKECKNCGDSFQPKRSSQKFCEENCAHAYMEAKNIKQYELKVLRERSLLC